MLISSRSYEGQALFSVRRVVVFRFLYVLQLVNLLWKLEVLSFPYSQMLPRFKASKVFPLTDGSSLLYRVQLEGQKILVEADRIPCLLNYVCLLLPLVNTSYSRVPLPFRPFSSVGYRNVSVRGMKISFMILASISIVRRVANNYRCLLT